MQYGAIVDDAIDRLSQQGATRVSVVVKAHGPKEVPRVKHHGEHYMLLYQDHAKWLANKATPEQARLFLWACGVVDYETGILSDKGKPLLRSDIAKTFGWSQRYTDELLAGLIGLGALLKERHGRNIYYRLTPEFGRKGKEKKGG